MRDLRPHILIAEFDPEILISLERVLEDEGFCTTTAWNTSQALAFLESTPFDLLLLSHHPPELNCERLLALVRERDMPAACVLLRSCAKDQFTQSFLGNPAVSAIVDKRHDREIVARVRECLPALKPGPRRVVAAS